MQRRYNEALKILELERQLKAPAAAAVSSGNLQEDSLENLLLGTSGGDAGSYLQEFDRFASWVDGSLDTYRVSSCMMSIVISFPVRCSPAR
jgi:hypothetical protein